MVNAQEYVNNNYPNKEKIKEIELKEKTTITGQLQVENFPQLEKINVKGSWNNWGEITKLVVKNCPNLAELDCSYNEIKEITIVNCPKLQKLDCSGNTQLEELAKFNGSKLDYSVVSYIGSLDSELYEQLKAGLPGKKHEDIGRMCFGCLANGGHGSKSDYRYHAEVELTKGGTIEYGVASNGNKRETCEVPEGGGLLVVDINSTDDGTIKIKRRQVQNKEVRNVAESRSEGSEKELTPIKYDLSEKESEIALLKTQIHSLEKLVGEKGMNLVRTEAELMSKQEKLSKLEVEINQFQSEKEKLEEMIQKLEDKLKQISDEQWKKQLQEGKAELTEKLLKVQKKLTDSEQQRQELKNEVDNFLAKFNELQQEKISDEENNQQLKDFLENYKEYLRDKVHVASEVLAEKIFAESQQQDIENEKQEYEAKIVQAEKFIKKVGK